MDKQTLKQKASMENAISICEYQSVGEEIANSVTHGIGTLFGIVALVLLIAFTNTNQIAWRITSFSIYGASLIFLYVVSTLFHSLRRGRTKLIFKTLDHAAIYVLIAGSYTPVTLILMRHSWCGWTLLGIVWAMAIAGIILKVFFEDKLKSLSVLFYLAMGWLVMVAFKPLAAAAPAGFILWLLLGGICYTLSIIFYGWHKLPYHHTIFHILILAGSVSHFFGFFRYLT